MYRNCAILLFLIKVISCSISIVDERTGDNTYEGDKLSLTCVARFNSNENRSAYDLQWSKNGNPFRHNDSRHRVEQSIHDENHIKIKLNLLATKISDRHSNNAYTCQLIDVSNSTNGLPVIVETKSTQVMVLKRVQFLSTRDKDKAIVGDARHVLSCRVSYDESYGKAVTFEWLFNNQLIREPMSKNGKHDRTPSHEQKYIIRGNTYVGRGQSQIFINKVAISDGGIYTCRVRLADNQTFQQEIRLNVQPSPSFDHSLTKMVKLDDRRVRVTCAAQEEFVRITWFVDQTLAITESMNVTFSDRSSTLTFEQTPSIRDISCVVKNHRGQVKHSFPLYEPMSMASYANNADKLYKKLELIVLTTLTMSIIVNRLTF